jgi:predicted lipoprotein with Yx(FWY)xxD motif
MTRRAPLLLTVAAALVGAAACTGSGATTAAPATQAPATVAPATAAPADTAAPVTAAPAAGATVNAEAVGSAGTILVDGATGMTLYIFTKDTKDSGTSVCLDQCLVTWPALTVDAGATPTGGDGVTGTLGTITRPDDGSLQVTYNGLPLYFFKNDQAPGDLNGVYENWETVAP